MLQLSKARLSVCKKQVFMTELTPKNCGSCGLFRLHCLTVTAWRNG